MDARVAERRLTDAPTAKVAYAEALASRRSEAERQEQRSRRISNLRLAVFVAACVAAWAAWGAKILGAGWVAVAAAAFVGLLIAHDASLRAARRARRSAEFYEAGLAHLDGRWVEAPCGGPSELRPDHPYCDDLDCLGPGSLFHRIDTARTATGQAVLARWLLEGSAPDEIRARQAAVAELRPRLALREDLAILEEDAREAIDSTQLLSWATQPIRLSSARLRVAAAILPAATIALALAGWFGPLGPLPALGGLLVQMGFAATQRGRVHAVLTEIETPGRELALLAGLLSRVESEDFSAPLLRDLGARLRDGDHVASREIAALRFRIDLLDARRNQLFAPIAGLLLWSTHIAFALEDWRARNGPKLSSWFETLGELEALNALAGYAYERPDDPFPEIVESGGLHFEAQGLGHPLLPSARCVRNDVRLDAQTRLLLISGSNMAGKSTLLRAIGVNAVLAQVGAPVCARQLVLSPVRPGASVQLRDSLLGGQSRFYAEVQRLREIFRMAEVPAAPPVLFLLDEILHGTNAQERRTGAERVVRALLDRGAAGLVTTHDLALAEIAERVEPPGVNLHFGDRVEGDVLSFDYQLAPGIAQQGNALALMRAIGLPV